MEPLPGVEKETIREIAREVSFKIRKANHDVFEPYGIRLSKKNLSEILGKIMEKTAADTFSTKLGYEVTNAQKDADPDIWFTRVKKPLEIKVTSTDNGWRGGEFSKRPFDYLLVSWGGDFNEFFVAHAHLDKKDWHSNIAKGYYAPTYAAKQLYEKADKVIFLGDFSISPRGAIRVKRENVLPRSPH